MDDLTLTLPPPTALADKGAERQTEAQRVRAMVEIHFDFVWRVLRRLGVPGGDADDAAQQCFLVASRRVREIGATEERAFLFQTAVRVASNANRTRRRHPEHGDDALTQVADPSQGVEERLDRQRARALLDEVLDSMPEALRATFVLFELEGFTTPEVASLQSIPLGTAASRIRRAREHFDAQVKLLKSRLAKGAQR